MANTISAESCRRQPPSAFRPFGSKTLMSCGTYRCAVSLTMSYNCSSIARYAFTTFHALRVFFKRQAAMVGRAVNSLARSGGT